MEVELPTRAAGRPESSSPTQLFEYLENCHDRRRAAVARTSAARRPAVRDERFGEAPSDSLLRSVSLGRPDPAPKRARMTTQPSTTATEANACKALAAGG